METSGGCGVGHSGQRRSLEPSHVAMGLHRDEAKERDQQESREGNDLGGRK